MPGVKHELKIWPQYFCRVKDGSKTFEIRENDRGFQSGDTVILKEWDPSQGEAWKSDSAWRKGYTGESLQFRIGYIHPLDEKRVVLSLVKDTP